MAHTTGNGWQLSIDGTDLDACKILSMTGGSNDFPTVDDTCLDTRGPAQYLQPDVYEVAPITLRLAFGTEATEWPDLLVNLDGASTAIIPPGADYADQLLAVVITLPIRSSLGSPTPASITGDAWVSSFTPFDTVENNTRVEGELQLQLKSGYVFAPETGTP